MSFIYTHNTSPRRFKKVIKNKSYYEAVEKQNKLLKSLGIDPHRTIRRDSFKVMPLEQVGKLQTFSSNSHLILQNKNKDYKSSNTKPVTNEKLAISSQYTIAPAYNKC